MKLGKELVGKIMQQKKLPKRNIKVTAVLGEVARYTDIKNKNEGIMHIEELYDDYKLWSYGDVC